MRLGVLFSKAVGSTSFAHLPASHEKMALHVCPRAPGKVGHASIRNAYTTSHHQVNQIWCQIRKLLDFFGLTSVLSKVFSNSDRNTGPFQLKRKAAREEGLKSGRWQKQWQNWNKWTILYYTRKIRARRCRKFQRAKDIYKPGEKVPIESFVKTFFADWLNWTFFWWLEPCLLCRSTQMHATTSCRSQSATTCDSSYVLQNTTPYWKSTTPVLPCTTKYSSVLVCTTKCTPYYKVLLQYYSVLHSTTL